MANYYRLDSGYREGKMSERNNPTEAPTRRQAIVSATVSLGALVLGPTVAWAATDEEEISRTAESIHQETAFKASRKRVYEAITDTKQFNQVSQLSAAMRSGMSLGTVPTEISHEVGGAFSIYGGYIVGRNIELVPNERIVQAWRVTRWDPGVYSIAIFKLREQGSGTRIVFDHTGFPKGTGEHLAAGWKANYWEPLEKFLA
jgi:activator of HSP90 ATPase